MSKIAIILHVDNIDVFDCIIECLLNKIYYHKIYVSLYVELEEYKDYINEKLLCSVIIINKYNNYNLSFLSTLKVLGKELIDECDFYLNLTTSKDIKSRYLLLKPFIDDYDKIIKTLNNKIGIFSSYYYKFKMDYIYDEPIKKICDWKNISFHRFFNKVDFSKNRYLDPNFFIEENDD